MSLIAGPLLDAPLPLRQRVAPLAVVAAPSRAASRDAAAQPVLGSREITLLGGRLHPLEGDMSVLRLGTSIEVPDVDRVSWARVLVTLPAGVDAVAVHPSLVVDLGRFIGPLRFAEGRLERDLIPDLREPTENGHLDAEEFALAGPLVVGAVVVSRSAYWDLVPQTPAAFATLGGLAIALHGRPATVDVGVTLAYSGAGGATAYARYASRPMPVEPPSSA